MGIPLVFGLVHVALVAPRYHVGSFDDDAAYILAAKGLLSGVGLTGHLANGETIAGLFPPGYSALIAPLVWLWPHAFLPLRLVSAVCFAAVFPLTWIWLGRHGVGPRLRTVALLVLAMGPPFATYGSMVMAETPFLVVLLLLVLGVERWCEKDRVWSGTGLAVVMLAGALIWVKQAGIGLVAGLILWLALSSPARGRDSGQSDPDDGAPLDEPRSTRRVRLGRGALVAGGVGVLLLPVIVARLSSGVPLAGSRYSQDLGGFYQGGILKRLVDVAPHSAWHLVATAIPATIVPYLEPLPIQGAWGDVWQVVSLHVTLLVAIGAAVWAVRRRDAAVPMTVVYLVESALWPFVNERRAILVLPFLVSWYVLGAAEAWALVQVRLAGHHARWRAGAVAAAGLLVALPLIAQAPRDYLYGWGQSSSHFGGSRYVAVLRQLGRPADVVESDYRSSTALFTGHATNWTAFISDQGSLCYGPSVLAALGADRAGFLLLADVNKPGQVDSTCLQSQALLGRWAVQILQTDRDQASVYELVGPFTGHPGLTDLLGGAPSAIDRSGPAEVSYTWRLGAPRAVTQVSLGQAALDHGPTDSVRLEFERPDGTWLTVAAAGSGVGDGRGRAPFLLAAPAAPVTTAAVRVVLEGPDPAAATVTDLAVLGPAS